MNQSDTNSKAKLANVSRPTLIDLFAGCGGMTQGFVDAGFEPVLSCEYDLSAAATYAANFGVDHTRWCDIADLHDDVPEVDVVIGGPPCQGFSNLGTKDPADPRNKLWREYVRILIAAKPKMFVIENVDRFHKSHEFGLLQNEVDFGLLSNYRIESAVLNAADYGTPQRRKRTIVIGSRVDVPYLPVATHSADEGDELDMWTSIRSVIEGLEEDPGTTSLPSSMTEYFGERVPGEFKQHELHIGRNPTRRSLDRYDHVPPGGGRFNLPDELLPNCWKNKKTGTTDVMGRLEWDKPSVTIRTEFFKPEKGKYLHPEWRQKDSADNVNRPITHLEAARIMTFPDDFVWCGTKINIAKQIGNAVPVRFAKAIADSVRDQLG